MLAAFSCKAGLLCRIAPLLDSERQLMTSDGTKQTAVTRLQTTETKPTFPIALTASRPGYNSNEYSRSMSTFTCRQHGEVVIGTSARADKQILTPF